MVWSWSFHRSSERHHQHKLQLEVKCSNFSICVSHQLPVKRHDISSLISIHVDNSGHSFDWKNVKILDGGNPKNSRGFLQAWHSGQSAINKHIEINPIYQPIRKIMHKYRNKNQTNGRHNHTQTK
ncbi:unnamed protein product [Schistosoma mattheei]|uniref:Uncharacterized protein n=1 Tax=Schistosoma mattheei TaxID=31246 RepID=A0AA85BWN5_9TREM|nr:unnamed protein product [Schistosoma mattheei]